MPHVAARTASRDRDTGRYQSHRPEQTLLYQIVDEYYPAFAALMAEQGKELPGYVQREFEEFLQCGRLEHGFLRVRCESCHAEHLVAFSCKRRGFCPSCGARRMAVISFSAHQLSQSTGERHRILRIPPLADAGRSTDLGPVDPGLSPQCRGSGSTEQWHDRLDLPSEGSSP